jgi:Amt family ammonium transporter
MWEPYPHWLNPGDNAWQMTAATLVGLMSVPGLVVLYGGVMQKRWSVNSMMMAFSAFAIVLIGWVLYGFRMAFGRPLHLFGASHGFLANIVGHPADVLGHIGEQGQAAIPLVTTGPAFHFPTATLVYFQFVFAGITPLLMLGSVLGRFNFKAWIPFVLLWSGLIYTVNAFALWGGGWFAQHGALDYSGGYVIHLAAGVSGFVAAAVIGPRLQRDREVDAPNNLLMVATGAGLLWLGWNGFNGGDPYYAGASASAAVLNTNLACAIAFLGWMGWDYATGRKPSLIGSVNGMITGLVAITPAAGYVNGWGALAIGIIGTTIVYFALNYLSRVRPFRNVDDTLGVIYTHGFAGLAGGLLTGVFADPKMVIYLGVGKTADITPFAGLVHGSATLLKEQVWAGAWIIAFSAIGTFVLLKLVGLVVPLRMSEPDMEEGDLAVHGHEVYPSDVPSLSFPNGGTAWTPAGSTTEVSGS